MDGIYQISFVRGIGDFVSEITSSSDRVGFVVSQGFDAIDAGNKCDVAMDMVNIAVEDVTV